jgi:hypothetical protein
MNKEFIPYQEAFELKQLKFNEPCFAYYYTLNGVDWKFAEKTEFYNLDDEIVIGPKFSLLVPTYSQAFRWFREKHKLGAIVAQFGWGIENEFGQIIYDISDDETPLCYEETELACLKKLIEIVKNGK